MRNRRNLGLGIISLLLLAVVMAAGTSGTASSQAGGEATEDVITGRNFSFEIDGKQLSIISVEPGSFRYELKDATMGNRQGNFKDFTVTKPQFGTWRVARYYDQGDLHLKKLFQQFARGERKTNPSDTGSLIYKDRDGNEARRVNFFGFTPLHYESINLDSRNSGQAAIEVMEFAVTRVEYGTSGKVSDGGGGKVSTTDGDALSDGSGTETRVTGFRIDLKKGGEDPASNWYSISGGAQILHTKDKTTGRGQYSLADGGDVEFGEVEIVGPFVSGGSRAELLTLLNQWATQSGERFNATLELLDSNQQVVRTVNFFDCIPTAYHPPSVRAGDDSLLEERFSFKPERVEG